MKDTPLKWPFKGSKPGPHTTEALFQEIGALWEVAQEHDTRLDGHDERIEHLYRKTATLEELITGD